MDDNNTLGNKIIIPDGCCKYNLEYSDIELAAIYSKITNNFIFLEKSLVKINMDEHLLNRLFLITMQYVNTTSSIDIIKLLIKQGIDINYTKNKNWTTPIYCCLMYKNIEIIKLLIENGADVNINFKKYYSLLIFAIRNSTVDNIFEITKILIRKGSKINYKDNNLKTALMICFEQKFDELIKFNIIKFLLDNKADVYIKNEKEKNILHMVKDKIGKCYCKQNCKNTDIYFLIFNYKNLENDHFCECDINFIYYNINFI